MGISPHRVREMLKKELRQIFRDPRMARLVFVAPVIQLVAFGYAVNSDIRHTATFVVDHDRTPASRDLLDAFESTGYFQITGRSERPQDLVRALDHGRARLGIEIPAGFESDLASGRGARVQILLDGTDSNTATVAQGYAGQIVQRFGARRAPAGSRGGASAVELRSRAWYNPTLESRVYNVPAVIGALILLMSLMLTALAVVREREMGTLDQLVVSPLSPGELILGKTVPVALIGLVQLLLITAMAVLWFRIPLRGSFLALLAAALLYIISGLSVGLLLSASSKTQQEAVMGMFLILLPAMLLSGFFTPISTMPKFFQWLTLLNPARHFIEIVRAIFLKGEGLAGLWKQYLALAAMAAGGLWLAVNRFRRSVAG